MLRIAAWILLGVTAAAQASVPQKFQPLHDTLLAYQIKKVPEPEDYPGMPAVALLTLQGYKQLDSKHERTIHKIIKILTPAGKEYTTVRIPCFGSCQVDARTIKPDGTIVSLPAKDLVRTERLTAYSTPYHYAQFALPGVEPGDIIEYTAAVEYPYPFYIDDFRFGEPYPILKGILTVMHTGEDSYTYFPTPDIRIHQDRQQEGALTFLRTTFVAENVPPVLDEPRAPNVRQAQPGVRMIIETKGGRKIAVFRDWFSFGSMILKEAQAAGVLSPEIQALAAENTDVAKLYREADRRIRITRESLLETGFAFVTPAQVLQKRTATPHDFALFLATCFRALRWSSDLILVNSHRQSDASKDSPFPLDLDLVFLNVKTPAGEFLLDCNRNGMPPGAVSSEAINRFAIGIPLRLETRITGSTTYLTHMPFRDSNKSHFEVNATPGPDVWNLRFTWTLSGEFQAEFLDILRQKGEQELRKEVVTFLRKSIRADQLRDINYKILPAALELHASATRPRRRVNSELELLQNEIWDSGFDIRQYLLDNRSNRLLLPFVGEVSSSYRIRIETEMNPALPRSFELECAPVRYALSFARNGHDVTVNEKISISDLMLPPAQFPKFTNFLNQYYAGHFWSILIANQPKVAEVPQ